MSLPLIASSEPEKLTESQRHTIILGDGSKMLIEEVPCLLKNNGGQPQFYRVLFNRSDDEVLDGFCRVLKPFLNEGPPGLRLFATTDPSRIQVFHILRQHVSRNVICVTKPIHGERLHAFYFPTGTERPYSSRHYLLRCVNDDFGYIKTGITG